MRLFVAIELGPRARAAMTRCQQRLARSDACRAVRWTHEDRLHLTVRFLGEVPDADVANVSTAVTKGLADVRPFAMHVVSVGCFPPDGRVRIVWVGLREDSGELVKLAKSLDGEFAALGFPSESRPFHPHVTIGRVKEDRSGGDLRGAIEARAIDEVVQPVDRVVLMSSVLARGGPTYSVVSAHPIDPSKRDWIEPPYGFRRITSIIRRSEPFIVPRHAHTQDTAR